MLAGRRRGKRNLGLQHCNRAAVEQKFKSRNPPTDLECSVRVNSVAIGSKQLEKQKLNY